MYHSVNGGDYVGDRDRINVPDELAERLDKHFGSASPSWSGTLVAALWYAVERYEAEHPDAHGDVADDQS